MNYSNFSDPHLSYAEISMENISPPPEAYQLKLEIQSLEPDQVILRTPPYHLFICNLDDKPALRQELGRLREITFRQVGESTGKSLDIDEYDRYYEQLIIWDHVAERLVGGYRFGAGDHIFEEYGRSGFYINSIFGIDPGFDPILKQSLELGRSFIIAEYQKKSLPLYLLWKGILAYQLRHPKYKYLIGPVSISRFYSDFSRKVLMDYAMKHLLHPEFHQWFKPKTPYDPLISVTAYHEIVGNLNGVAMDLQNIIDHIQPEHLQFPVLMKQYIRQNARFLGFNLDPNFNDALDGLMILDIADVPSSTLEMLQREM